MQEKESSSKSSIQNMLKALGGAALLATVSAQFLVHGHAEFPWEAVPAFYALSGFVLCAVIVAGARILRVLVQRDEDYHD